MGGRLGSKGLAALVQYFQIEGNLSTVVGFYPQVGRDAVLKADLVFCLGLLYHLDNLLDGLAPMVESRPTLVIEGIFFRDAHPLDERGWARGFDPTDHTNAEAVCALWLGEYLERQGFAVSWLKSWQEFVERPGNLRHSATRKALIAAYRASSRRSGGVDATR